MSMCKSHRFKAVYTLGRLTLSLLCGLALTHFRTQASLTPSAYTPIFRGTIALADTRRALYDRFAFSQRFARVDPWAERVAGRHHDQFNPMSRRLEFAPA